MASALLQLDIQLPGLERLEFTVDVHLAGVRADKLLLVVFDEPTRALMHFEKWGFFNIAFEGEILTCAVMLRQRLAAREGLAVLIVAPLVAQQF